jgi:hypothetical protein
MKDTRKNTRTTRRRTYAAPRLIPVGSIAGRTGACSDGCGWDNDANTAWYSGCGDTVEAL